MKSDTNAPNDGRKWGHSLTSMKSMVVLLLLLGLLLFWLRGRQETLSDTEAAMHERTARAAVDADPEARRSARMKSGGRALPEGVITTHEPEQLKDFYLIECRGQRVSIHTALKLLDEAYRDACYFSLEKPLELHYTVEGQSDKLISFSIKGKTWSDALNYIAALAGMKVKQNGLEVLLVPIVLEISEPSLDFVTKGLKDQLLQNLIDRGEWDAQAENPDFLTLLRLHGLSEMAEISFANSGAILLLEGSSHDKALIDTLFNMENKTPGMLTIKNKIICSSQALELPQGAMDEEAAAQWLKELTEREGASILSAPSHTAAAGKSATVEVKQENGESWTGMQFDFTVKTIGLKYSAENLTEIRPIDQKLADQRAEFQWLVYAGDTQVKAIGNDAGGYYYQMTSINNSINRADIDEMLNNPNRVEYPVAKAIPGKVGYVFSPYTNKVVDVRDLPQGVLVADPNFPPEEKKFFRVP